MSFAYQSMRLIAGVGAVAGSRKGRYLVACSMGNYKMVPMWIVVYGQDLSVEIAKDKCRV